MKPEVRSTNTTYPILTHRYALNSKNSRSSEEKPRNTERHSKIQVWGKNPGLATLPKM